MLSWLFNDEGPLYRESEQVRMLSWPASAQWIRHSTREAKACSWPHALLALASVCDTARWKNSLVVLLHMVPVRTLLAYEVQDDVLRAHFPGVTNFLTDFTLG